jgi:GntR family transcriptional regulator, rspAB operon transcriptional repressor
MAGSILKVPVKAPSKAPGKAARKGWRQAAPPAGRKGQFACKRRLTSQIKERILTLHFLPDQYVNEGALCAMRGAGRTPVHQALERLESASRSCRARV